MTAREAESTPSLTADLLFTDGLPALDDEVGYRGAVAARAAGITYRQLDYWARTELVEPTFGQIGTVKKIDYEIDLGSSLPL